MCIAFANLKPIHPHNNPNPVINHNQQSIGVQYIHFRKCTLPPRVNIRTRCRSGSSVPQFSKYKNILASLGWLLDDRVPHINWVNVCPSYRSTDRLSSSSWVWPQKTFSILCFHKKSITRKEFLKRLFIGAQKGMMDQQQRQVIFHLIDFV